MSSLFEPAPLCREFCKEVEKSKIAVPSAGVGFGMAGCEHGFCTDCLMGVTAYEFLDKMAKVQMGFGLPLKLKKGDNE